MDDNPAAVADRLSRYVDELLDARRRRDTATVRGRTQMIVTALDKLRAAYQAVP